METCNNWLANELRGTVGAVNLDEGVVLTDGDSIDVAWEARTKVGHGSVLCSTDRNGRKVIEAQIDGIQVAV